VTGEWLPPQVPGGEPPPQPQPEYPQQQPQHPPPGYWQPPPAQPQQPPNNEAVAGFTCGIVGVSLLFFTAGLSSIVSLVLGVVAIPYSRKGKGNVADGRTAKHKDLANAGFVIAIITVVLSIIAIAAWVLIFTTVDINWEEFDDPNDDPFDENDFSLR
jgi:cbb3-type cytochrome oxidase subunit 3